MKTLPHFRHALILLTLIAITGLISCEKKDSGPEIEWLTGSYVTYNYKSGVLAGFTAYINLIIMKKNNLKLLIFVIVIMVLIGCADKQAEGVVTSIPMSMPFNELASGKSDNMTFTGDVVTVRLENGKEVKALATHEQMEQALTGKNKATMEKVRDDTHKNVEWKIIQLEEQDKQE